MFDSLIESYTQLISWIRCVHPFETYQSKHTYITKHAGIRPLVPTPALDYSVIPQCLNVTPAMRKKSVFLF